MALKTILWFGFFAAACLGALWDPIIGIFGYIVHYSIGPEKQWWYVPLKSLELRNSLLLASFTLAGVLINWGRLQYGKRLLHGYEMLLFLFLGIIWISALLNPETVGRYTQAGIDHPQEKMVKVVIFMMILSHVVTQKRNLDRLFWAFTLSGLILGLQAYSKPYNTFQAGRLESVGGAEFNDSNMFAAFMVAVLFVIGGQFLRYDKLGKAMCTVAGAFTANAVILARSRGAFIGLVGGGLTLLLWAPRKYRSKIIAGMVVAGVGFFWLSDTNFFDRMSTITSAEEERDSSAQSRIKLAKAGLEMLLANPLGVGPGNWKQNIGKYAPEYAWGKDAHNTYVRCAGELGFPGIAVLSAIILCAIRLLLTCAKEAQKLQGDEAASIAFAAYAALAGLISLLCYSLTHTLLYIEYFWWFLAMPAIFARIVENLKEAQAQYCEDSEFDSAEVEEGEELACSLP